MYRIATLYCNAMFSCDPLHVQNIYTVLYRHVQLCLTTYTVQLHYTGRTCSAVTHYIYSIATLYCTAMFGCASQNIQYSYTLRYRHIHLCLTTYTDQLHCTLPPFSSVPHYIYSIAIQYCTEMFRCTSLHIQYSYTVLYHQVQLCLTKYTVQPHCIVPPCSAVPQYIYSIATLYCTSMFRCDALIIQYSYTALYRYVQLCLNTYTRKLHSTVPPYSAVPQYIYRIATLHSTAMFIFASIHIQYSYIVLYRHVQF